jgi:hypothetical protein
VFPVPSPRPNAVATVDYSQAAGRELATPQTLTKVGPKAARGDAAMYKLSKRLWSIEIHRRLEIQTRRAL